MDKRVCKPTYRLITWGHHPEWVNGNKTTRLRPAKKNADSVQFEYWPSSFRGVYFKNPSHTQLVRMEQMRPWRLWWWFFIKNTVYLGICGCQKLGTGKKTCWDILGLKYAKVMEIFWPKTRLMFCRGFNKNHSRHEGFGVFSWDTPRQFAGWFMSWKILGKWMMTGGYGIVGKLQEQDGTGLK